MQSDQIIHFGEDDERDKSCLNTFLETINNLEMLDNRIKETSREENPGKGHFNQKSGQQHKKGGSEYHSNFSIENSAIFLKEQLERYKIAIGESLFADCTLKKSFRKDCTKS